MYLCSEINLLREANLPSEIDLRRRRGTSDDRGPYGQKIALRCQELTATARLRPPRPRPRPPPLKPLLAAICFSVWQEKRKKDRNQKEGKQEKMKQKIK